MSVSEAKNEQKKEHGILWPLSSRIVWNDRGQIHQRLVLRLFCFNAPHQFTPLPNLRLFFALTLHTNLHHSLIYVFFCFNATQIYTTPQFTSFFCFNAPHQFTPLPNLRLFVLTPHKFTPLPNLRLFCFNAPHQFTPLPNLRIFFALTPHTNLHHSLIYVFFALTPHTNLHHILIYVFFCFNAPHQFTPLPNLRLLLL